MFNEIEFHLAIASMHPMYIEAIHVTTNRDITPYPVHAVVMLKYKLIPILAWLCAHITY